MDPVTGLGLAGSVVSIIEVIARSIAGLKTLQLRWQAANRTVNALLGQLSTLKVALHQISQLLSSSLGASPQHHQFVIDLSVSLECCEDSIGFIDDQVSKLEWREEDELTFSSNARVVLNDSAMKESVNHLNSQSITLNLLLSALNW